MTSITKEDIFKALGKVIDPELGIDIVKLGLVYSVDVAERVYKEGEEPKNHVTILMTLTTPGCPLAGVFDAMVRDALYGLSDLNPDTQVTLNLTFDPPWVPDMMDEEAKAELGF